MNTVTLKPNVKRIAEDITRLAEMVDQTKPGWTRRPFTKWYKQSREWLVKEMERCGLSTRVDAASNLIGRLEGSDPRLAPIMIGSHTDTVNGGGRFDGIIGVLAGLEIARLIKEEEIQLKHPLEIVDFTAEEPSEFGISTIGSRGMVNNLSEEMLNRADPSGLILKDAIKEIGGDPYSITSHARKQGDVSLYLEVHIEQGPVLEQSKNKLGVVTGIVGIQRYRVSVEGKPNHAGTTPMNMRNDALTAASELVLQVESICSKAYSEPVVGTVGKHTVEPNASNVIPGKVVFDLEMRSLDMSIIESLMANLIDFGNQVEQRRSVTVKFDCLSKSESIKVETQVLNVIEEACIQTAATTKMPSGAGHDANQLAKVAPIGMIFVPSLDGRSHCPEEWTNYEDVSKGVEALARAVLLFDERQ